MRPTKTFRTRCLIVASTLAGAVLTLLFGHCTAVHAQTFVNVNPASAFSRHDGVGINIRQATGSYPRFDVQTPNADAQWVLKTLGDLGVKHISGYDSRVTKAQEFPNLEIPLSQTYGIKWWVGTSFCDTDAMLTAVANPPAGVLLEAVTMQNEPDLSTGIINCPGATGNLQTSYPGWENWVVTRGPQIYGLIKAANPNMKVIAPSIIGAGHFGNASQCVYNGDPTCSGPGDISSFVDGYSMHVYPGANPLNPSVGGNNAHYGCGPGLAFGSQPCFTHFLDPSSTMPVFSDPQGRKLYEGEIGYGYKSFTNGVIAKYIVRLHEAYALQGYTREYFFQLCPGATNFTDKSLTVNCTSLSYGGAPNAVLPQYTALQSYLTLMNDPGDANGTYVPPPFSVAFNCNVNGSSNPCATDPISNIVNSTNKVYSDVIEASNGTILLGSVVEGQTQYGGSNPPQAPVAIAPVNVSWTLPGLDNPNTSHPQLITFAPDNNYGSTGLLVYTPITFTQNADGTWTYAYPTTDDWSYISFQVAPTPSQTAVQTSPASTTVGSPVIFTVSVSDSTNGSVTGSATLLDGTTALATLPLNSSGTATYTTSSLALGVHSISATYSGDGSHAPSTSSTYTETITPTPVATQATIAASAASATQGLIVTFQSTVSATANGTPSGTLTFLDGAITLGTATLDAGGSASFQTSTLALGTHQISAQYSGDLLHLASASTSVSLVVLASTQTTLSTSNASSVAGTSVSFSATVIGSGGVAPTGSVTLFDGASSLGSQMLGKTGVALFATSALSVGSHTITAAYAGDSNNQASTSSPITQTITPTPVPTQAALATSAASANQGSTITFQSTVSATANGTPSGTVTFLDGSITLGSATLNAGGSATFQTSTLAAGPHQISAQYGGDSLHLASASTSVSEVILASTQTTLSTSNASGVAGTSVSFSATVSASGGVAPTGLVTFFDGPSSLGSQMLGKTGGAVFPTSALSVGSHSITAAYAGDSNNQASTSSPITEIVTAAPVATQTSMTASSTSVNLGSPVTLQATVSSSGNGAATGMLTFLDGGSVLSTVPLTAGSASYQTSALAVGIHVITAQYSGDSLHLISTSATAGVTIVAPAFALSTSAAAITMTNGISPVVQIAATPVGGFSGTVQLLSSGLPSNTVAIFSPSSLVYNGSSTPQSSTLTLTGNTLSADLSLPRSANPFAFCILIGIGACGVVRRRLCTSGSFGVTRLGSILAMFALCGVLSGCGSSTIGSNANPVTPKGTYTITITASSGSMSQTTNITLQVN